MTNLTPTICELQHRVIQFNNRRLINPNAKETKGNYRQKSTCPLKKSCKRNSAVNDAATNKEKACIWLTKHLREDTLTTSAPSIPYHIPS